MIKLRLHASCSQAVLVLMLFAPVFGRLLHTVSLLAETVLSEIITDLDYLFARRQPNVYHQTHGGFLLHFTSYMVWGFSQKNVYGEE